MNLILTWNEFEKLPLPGLIDSCVIISNEGWNISFITREFAYNHNSIKSRNKIITAVVVVMMQVLKPYYLILGVWVCVWVCVLWALGVWACLYMLIGTKCPHKNKSIWEFLHCGNILLVPMRKTAFFVVCLCFFFIQKLHLLFKKMFHFSYRG